LQSAKVPNLWGAMTISSIDFVKLDPSTGSNRYTIVIVGGGFSGAIVAAQLLNQLPTGQSIAIVEKNGALGEGVAYSTRVRRHLLNVSAKGMSGIPDRPEHFLQWLRLHFDPAVSADDFVPRYIFAQYCQSILADSLAKRPDIVFCRIQAEAVALWTDGATATVRLQNGSILGASIVILATGNNPPARGRIFSLLPDKYYARNAWSKPALEEIPKHGNVLLLGSGLTAIDQVVALEEQGFTGTVLMLSRRGLLPAVHKVEPAWPNTWTRSLGNNLSAIVSAVQLQIEAAANAGMSWRVVIDSLRPDAQRLWKSLSVTEQKRFLRHLRPYWDVHRHRLPPGIDALMSEWVSDGRLRVVAGTVVGCRELDDTAEVVYRVRYSNALTTIRVHRIVNCTGSDTDIRTTDSSLLQSILNQGLGRLDSLNMGLDVSECGELISHSGQASGVLFTLGPTQKGCLWETTAVPEIRVQATQLARHIAEKIGIGSSSAQALITDSRK
jgi:uncharacterized NAD(P)/FAD-binding protein YdhS